MIITFEELESSRKIPFLIGLRNEVGKKELNGAYAIFVSGKEQMIELTFERYFIALRAIPKMAFEKTSKLPRIE